MTNIHIRPARLEDCPALGRILVSATRHAFEGRVPDRCLNWITPEESAANWVRNFEPGGILEQGSHLFVAETAAGEVVALALLDGAPSQTLPDLDDGAKSPPELRVIQVDPAWQRQGLGTKLLAHIARVLRREGASSLTVRVLIENPNRPFYERLGAVELGASPYVWEGHVTLEIIYFWKNLDSLKYPA